MKTVEILADYLSSTPQCVMGKDLVNSPLALLPWFRISSFAGPELIACKLQRFAHNRNISRLHEGGKRGMIFRATNFLQGTPGRRGQQSTSYLALLTFQNVQP
jgi:hypothetical protein